MKLSWVNISDRIHYELMQLSEEGIDVNSLSNEWAVLENKKERMEEFDKKAELFYSKLELIQHNDIDSSEPSIWSEIVKSASFENYKNQTFIPSLVEEKILGGWLGRSAGCLLGKPVEKLHRSVIKEMLSANQTWPISDYITEKGIPQTLLIKYPWNKHSGRESLKENIECMSEDDDMNYPMLNLSVFEKFGKEFTSSDIVNTWLEYLPALSTFTAERVAYQNALGGILPPMTAQIKNPYREWIGAQIRADFWGWISPGDPKRAVEFAWRDAQVSHVKNGIYGEMFFAAAISLAFVVDNPLEVIKKALLYIPGESRFSKAIEFVLSLPIKTQSWETTVDALYEKYGTLHWVHTINNASLIVASLIASEGNYEKGICNVVMGGWDTDSNGATIGSILGTMNGEKGIPTKWKLPLKNTIRSSIKGYDHSLLSELASRTSKIANHSIK